MEATLSPISDLDAIYPLAITAAEAAAGVSRTVRFFGPDGAPREISVTVPAGVTSGSRIVIPGSEQWSCGRLVLHVTVLPHARSEVRGDTLRIELEADRATALRDGKIEVPISGDVVAVVPVHPEMWDGMFVYPGQGLPRAYDRSKRGDLMIHVRLVETGAVMEAPAGEAPAQNTAPLEAPIRSWWRTLLPGGNGAAERSGEGRAHP
jgi:hypothetical protein